MLLYDELRISLLDAKPQLDDLKVAMGYSKLTKELSELEQTTAQEGFWEDVERSQKILRRTKQIQEQLQAYDHLVQRYEDTLVLIDLAMEEEDPSADVEIKHEVSGILAELEAQKLATLLTGEYDDKNAILTIHAGTGGTEAQDWAQLLYRMYTRWAERHEMKCKILDYLPCDEAGIKSASILIEGLHAYGFLKSEAGVHRLVRVSPFDTAGRRHTSFASVEVLPEIDDDTDIVIDEKDLRVDTYRSSGAGGQHVNKTSSAVRLTHLPTGIVVACQNERSQHQNKEVAMKMLKSKLLEIKEREHYDKIEDIKGDVKEIAWGSQIRSYVFMPYTLVKDHRTGYESGNIQAVMDGDLDGFINAYLKYVNLGEGSQT